MKIKDLHDDILKLQGLTPEQAKGIINIIQTTNDENMDKLSQAIKDLNSKMEFSINALNSKMEFNINTLTLKLDSTTKELNTKVDSIKWFIITSFGILGLLIAGFKFLN